MPSLHRIVYICKFKMSKLHNKIVTEKNTVKVMIAMYCNKHHGTNGYELCMKCKELSSYSLQRLDTCTFGENKPPCKTCQVHCYRTSYRKLIVEIMKYSGPRMIIKHPLLAIAHFIRSRRKIKI